MPNRNLLKSRKTQLQPWSDDRSAKLWALPFAHSHSRNKMRAIRGINSVNVIVGQLVSFSNDFHYYLFPSINGGECDPMPESMSFSHFGKTNKNTNAMRLQFSFRVFHFELLNLWWEIKREHMDHPNGWILILLSIVRMRLLKWRQHTVRYIVQFL